MKISVLLPCFNGARTLKTQLEALAQQTWQGDWEVIVSNNGSTDDSMAIVEQYRDRLPQLKIVEAHNADQPRLGSFHSYNMALQAAKGDAFLLCEADDEVDRNWLAAMAEALNQHPFVVARMEYRRLNPEWLLPRLGAAEQEKGLCQNPNTPYPCAFGCTFGLRHSVYERLGGFSPAFAFAYDAEYCWRAQKAGISIEFVPTAVVHYRLRHDSSARFRQGANWGEDFTLAARCYGLAVSRLQIAKAYLNLAKFSVRGLWLWPMATAPWTSTTGSSKQRYADWIWGLGWMRGSIRGMLKPLPLLSVPEVADVYQAEISV